MTVAAVELWGTRIGAVALTDSNGVASFEYEPSFLASGIQLAPLMMALAARVYSFPELQRRTFRGLPGLLADSLPDRFGNNLINAWLARQGRTPESFDAVERLCYTGQRGMGALEFKPVQGPSAQTSGAIQIAELVALASEILSQQQGLATSFQGPEREEALQTILRVGTSAGGARAKALIVWNASTGEVRSGQLEAPPGFSHWLLKFDGVSGNKDREREDPQGYGLIELAYSRMARAAGITMTDCRLLEENGRQHFMTRRFDRDDAGNKLHMQSLGALAHFDYNEPGSYSYEQAFLVMRQLQLPMQALEEQYRRMVFNLIARNQDDHVKNIAFLMDRDGQWSLSPAFDITWSFNPAGDWTASHQMSVNGKRDQFTRADLLAVGRSAQLKRGRAEAIAEEVIAAVRDWPLYAAEANVREESCSQIQASHRLNL
ncbi:type II toxin-antitoxin system HipA family toxin [Synechococcus sp. CS-1331]|uniref:type II toxin-antitoxin system HipA family toxin n=1 Tax=Synechococcus sp. CS-1331 TaxID=2847973 RepID=UPI00199C21FE|nr:type II toxin-antitoxin system HipA family toxin [Synechococcus sp. CS-1331]MCT0226911.1 type II toxin-antitoxin system HipA family toxin [Synechococcus sp. CS-1331]NQW38198.1 type II toxin-antitoxin system HipA family toxin [Cyanobacteria bacterium bin.275]